MKISITVKTRSKKEMVKKTENGYVVYVKEQPIENRANIALIKLLSEYFDVPKSRVAILSGTKSKQKIVEIKE
ncbi:MAG: DUF167 domain-containing protein [Nitrospirae bacterium]|nr:DUF167 domain-containing protein [Nitrospirota bacterium]